MKVNVDDLFKRDQAANERLIGSDNKYHVIAGMSALEYNGLTTLHSSVIQCWTLKTGINGIDNGIVKWYFNPWSNKTIDTRPSKNSQYLLVPSAERALIEYMVFSEYFDEGILLEGISDYLGRYPDAEDRLLQEIRKFIPQREDLVPYWINESKDWTGA